VNEALHSSRLRLAVLAIAAVGALAGLLMLVQASSSTVSTAHAGAVDCQYFPNDPSCNNPNPQCPDPSLDCPGEGTNPNVNQGAQPNGGAGEGGELPFTGYPVTPLILLLLMLLAAGLMIRTYLAARDRLHAGHAGNLPLA
jgi:hypothetical protein